MANESGRGKVGVVWLEEVGEGDCGGEGGGGGEGGSGGGSEGVDTAQHDSTTPSQIPYIITPHTAHRHGRGVCRPLHPPRGVQVAVELGGHVAADLQRRERSEGVSERGSEGVRG